MSNTRTVGIFAGLAVATLAAAALFADLATAQPDAPLPTLAERITVESPYAIRADPQAEAFVTAAAEKAIAERCASCHGADLRGKPGVPNLLDYEFLWGVTFEETSDVGPVMEIEQTIRYGVRNQDCPAVASQAQYGDCPDTRYSEMPGYGELGALTAEQISDLTDYTLKLSGQPADEAAAARGQSLFGICTECHGAEGRGYKPYGGPDLTDDVSLYGNDRAAITESISKGRMGRCPAWIHTLDAATIKSLAVYLWRKIAEG
jgi:cytochrome c oxidase cbb3-type subunit 3